jgi:hypothetical protein
VQNICRAKAMNVIPATTVLEMIELRIAPNHRRPRSRPRNKPIPDQEKEDG